MIKSLKRVLKRRLNKIIDEQISRGINNELYEKLISGVNFSENGNLTQLKIKLATFDIVQKNVKNFGYILARDLYAPEMLTKQISKTRNFNLLSKVCTQEDMESDWALYWASKMRIAPFYHRKLWELCYIAQVAWECSMLVPEKSAIVFGVGDEPLPSLFASLGVKVLATDCPPDLVEEKGWSDSNQWGEDIEKIRKKEICADSTLLQNISFDFVDMNNIKPDYFNESFDFCWSACALEHLGSIQKGLDFIENSLKCLKPGGVAIHTTEYCFTSEEETIDNWPTVLYLKKHINAFIEKMEKAGHKVRPVNYDIGDKPLDGFMDIPPYPEGKTQHAHLKLNVDGYGCTSLGLIIHKNDE